MSKSVFIIFLNIAFGSVALSTTTVTIGSAGDHMYFDKTYFEVKAGSRVKILFKNNSTFAEHNLVIVKPGTVQQVVDQGFAADAKKDFIVESPNIIAHTRMLEHGESQILTFKAPTTPEDYPYTCTYPTHAAGMKGVMRVLSISE